MTPDEVVESLRSQPINHRTGGGIEVRNLFPIILIVLDLCASLVYGFYQDWIRVVYWIGAAALTWCSIWMR
jgi:hypothetical protein